MYTLYIWALNNLGFLVCLFVYLSIHPKHTDNVWTHIHIHVHILYTYTSPHICTYIYTYIYIYINTYIQIWGGYLAGSLKSLVCFAKEAYERDHILQKRLKF